MNEKINGLWDKAVTLVEQEPDGDWSLDTIKDKFAELIIRECARVTFKGTGPRSALNILEHFGVEE